MCNLCGSENIVKYIVKLVFSYFGGLSFESYDGDRLFSFEVEVEVTSRKTVDGALILKIIQIFTVL
jgi:hypothetical protein